MEKFNCLILIDDEKTSSCINYQLLKKLSLPESISIFSNEEEVYYFLKNWVSRNKGLPELILLDIDLPMLDEIESIERYRNFNSKNKEQVKILALKPSFALQTSERIQEFEVTHFLNKLLTSEKLNEILSSQRLLKGGN
jgi:two-component SAPR family response regulator